VLVNRLCGNAILCIGNDPILLNLRCALLKKHGWRVISSGSGHDGVNRLGQEAVDAVVLDLNADGSESALITGELKRQRPDVPVILLRAEEMSLAAGATAQADAVIPKSEETKVLHETLRKLLKTS
jgi:DNA-binding response OmpR family regulator